MKQRWLVAIVGLPLLLLVLVACPAWATVALVCAIAGVAAYELVHTVEKNVQPTVYGITICCAVGQVLAAYLERKRYDAGGLLTAPAGQTAPLDRLWVMPVVLLFGLFFYAVLYYGTDRALPFAALSAAAVGGAVFPTMYGCILLLRMDESYGRLYVLAPFFIAFAGDSLAMYGGKWFGKKKLTPVSPNKTWAGFYGGVFGSVAGMLLFGLIGSHWLGYPAAYGKLALAGAAGNLVGQLGDLAMSLIKREHGIKDYSRLFLTHGGMLDRFDSTLFIAPVLYFFVYTGLI